MVVIHYRLHLGILCNWIMANDADNTNLLSLCGFAHILQLSKHLVQISKNFFSRLESPAESQTSATQHRMKIDHSLFSKVSHRSYRYYRTNCVQNQDWARTLSSDWSSHDLYHTDRHWSKFHKNQTVKKTRSVCCEYKCIWLKHKCTTGVWGITIPSDTCPTHLFGACTFEDVFALVLHSSIPQLEQFHAHSWHHTWQFPQGTVCVLSHSSIGCCTQHISNCSISENSQILVVQTLRWADKKISFRKRDTGELSNYACTNTSSPKNTTPAPEPDTCDELDQEDFASYRPADTPSFHSPLDRPCCAADCQYKDKFHSPGNAE